MITPLPPATARWYRAIAVSRRAGTGDLLDSVYVSNDDPTPGILTMAAADGHRLAYVELPSPYPDTGPWVINSRPLPGIMRSTVPLDTDPVPGEFPDFRRVVPPEVKHTVSLSLADLLIVLKVWRADWKPSAVAGTAPRLYIEEQGTELHWVEEHTTVYADHSRKHTTIEHRLEFQGSCSHDGGGVSVSSKLLYDSAKALGSVSRTKLVDFGWISPVFPTLTTVGPARLVIMPIIPFPADKTIRHKGL